MTTKVTDKGIIYPDGTEQTTAAFGSGGGSVDAYTKEETDNKFYDKEEINNLLEASSGAIVGNYKVNYPNSVARDPEAGNLYLVNIMSFTNNYDEVTTLYISKTDADGTERDLSQIVANDIINLESANGSGSYIIQSFSDSGAYFEIIVDRGDCSGTLAQDDDVTARLEVASVGGSGSLPKGSIIMWSDPTIPEGWQICDGTNDTPDLRDKFVVGAGSTYNLDATGGSADAVVVSHSHSVTINNSSGLSGWWDFKNRGGSSFATPILANSSGGKFTHTNRSNSGSYGEGYRGESGSGSSRANINVNHNHSGSVSNSGDSGKDKNLPPYYAIYYIIKMVEDSGSGGSGGTGGDSIWTEEDGNKATYSSTGDTTVIAKANSGQYATYQVDNADQKYSMQIRPDQNNAFVIRNETSGQNSLTIGTDGSILFNGQPLAWTQSGNDLVYVSPNTDSGVYINSQEDNNINIVGYNGTDSCDLWLRRGDLAPNTGLGITAGGVVKLTTVNTNSNSTNMLNYIPATGAIERTNASFYNTEEVDKKLAIKDKLIEKLSARLDELEKRVK